MQKSIFGAYPFLPSSDRTRKKTEHLRRHSASNDKIKSKRQMCKGGHIAWAPVLRKIMNQTKSISYLHSQLGIASVAHRSAVGD